MTRLIALVAAILSFIALILVAISLATNFWITFDDPEESAGSNLNPPVINSNFDGFTVSYNLDHFGLWVGCHRAQGFDKISCGYIGSSCNSDICWVRDKTEKKCEDNRVTPIINCAAYQATRAMTIIGTIFLIAGSSILVVAICIASRVLPSSGAICTFIGGLFLMIGFSIFYSEIFSPLSDIVDVSWSLILLIVAWPLAIIAGLMGMTAMFAGSKGAERADDEDSD